MKLKKTQPYTQTKWTARDTADLADQPTGKVKE